MNPIRFKPFYLCLLLGLCLYAASVRADVNQGGNIKLSDLGYAIFNQASPGTAQYGNLGLLSLRYKFESHGATGLDFQMHYQLSGQYQSGASPMPLASLVGSSGSSDLTRAMDLTVINGNTIQRLDRLNIGYTGNKLVWRLGRQAISWGNGMSFQVLDFLNPTPPGSLNSDYKVGDDMLYLQWLTNKGNDWQLVWVWRRNALNGKLDAQQSTLAWKYRWITEGGVGELLLAQHYGQSMLGFSLARNLGDHVLRLDFLNHDLSSNGDWLYLVNTDTSWGCGGHNCHMFIEYFYNQAAQTLIDLATLPVNISQRYSRGELFVRGREYISIGFSAQTSPLGMLNITLMHNLHDRSTSNIIGYAYDFKENWQIQSGAMFGLGNANSEFGGLYDSGSLSYESTAGLLYFQIAHYF